MLERLWAAKIVALVSKKVFNISHLTDFKKGREETLSAIDDFLYFLFCPSKGKCNLLTEKSLDSKR